MSGYVVTAIVCFVVAVAMVIGIIILYRSQKDPDGDGFSKPKTLLMTALLLLAMLAVLIGLFAYHIRPV